jgi:hypothetical protein
MVLREVLVLTDIVVHAHTDEHTSAAALNLWPRPAPYSLDLRLKIPQARQAIGAGANLGPPARQIVVRLGTTMSLQT